MSYVYGETRKGNPMISSEYGHIKQEDLARFVHCNVDEIEKKESREFVEQVFNELTTYQKENIYEAYIKFRNVGFDLYLSIREEEKSFYHLPKENNETAN